MTDTVSKASWIWKGTRHLEVCTQKAQEFVSKVPWKQRCPSSRVSARISAKLRPACVTFGNLGISRDVEGLQKDCSGPSCDVGVKALGQGQPFLEQLILLNLEWMLEVEENVDTWIAGADQD